MRTIRKSITFTQQQDTYIKSLVDKGFYTNDSEYIRDIVRKDQENRRYILELQEALTEGIASGASSDTIDTIWETAIKNYAKK